MTASAASPEHRELLETARVAVREASQLLAAARPSAIRSKSNARDLVTEWDLRAEERIRKVLEERAPGVPILGEEGGLGVAAAAASSTTAGQAGGLRWLVDPIDGTVNFAHGLPIWSVSIALERLPDELDQGELLVGVVSAPLLGWWFEAVKHGGARDGNGAPLQVSTIEDLESAMLATGFPYDIATNPQNNLAEWNHLYKTAGTCRRLGCASLDVCMVACGWLDGYWERHLQSWDFAAGALIAREAGANVTRLDGSPFDVHGGEILATNGTIHERLVAELASLQ